VVGIKGDGADLNSLSGDIFLFELAGDVPFDEGCLSDSTVSDENDFKFRHNVGVASVGSLNC
jgi:hypothetical protein